MILCTVLVALEPGSYCGILLTTVDRVRSVTKNSDFGLGDVSKTFAKVFG